MSGRGREDGNAHRGAGRPLDELGSTNSKECWPLAPVIVIVCALGISPQDFARGIGE
jgi:hypothetical protein